MPQQTLQTAAELTQALHETTAALNAVKARFRFILVFVVALALILALTIKTRYDARIEFCQKDNEVRAGLLYVTDILEANAEEIDAKDQQFLDAMRDSFALRDCSDVSVF